MTIFLISHFKSYLYVYFRFLFISISLFLKQTVRRTYTEKVQINELIKLHVHIIYASTLTRQMELAGKTDFNIGTTDYLCFSELGIHI